MTEQSHQIREPLRIPKAPKIEAETASNGLKFLDMLHEIRNPLNGISTAVQLIMRRLANSKASEDNILVSYVDSLAKEVTHLHEILLDVQAVWAPELQILPIHMDFFIADLLRSEPLNSVDARVRVETELQENCAVFKSDEKLLKRALSNLIKNSLEAMPDGGTLTLRAFVENGTAVIDVVDTGSGIPEQIQVFARYGTSKPAGMGLGLNIVKQITALLHGEITYSPRQEGGTIFRLSLPQN